MREFHKTLEELMIKNINNRRNKNKNSLDEKRVFKASSDLLQLDKILDHLSKQKNYTEASKVKKEIR